MNNNIKYRRATYIYGSSDRQSTTRKLLLFLSGFLITVSSCKKLVDVNPPTNKVTGASVYQNDGTAISALTSLYISLGTYTPTSVNYPIISLLGGLSGDEFTLWSGVSDLRLTAYYTNNLSANPIAQYGTEFWIYPPIFTCNSAIEALTDNNALTPAVRKQLLGEAKFMRAFYYFYLTNLYEDLPLALTTDYKVNSTLSRSPKSDVYLQIISDLKDAEELLSDKYLASDLINGSTERVRPTKWAAAALLARAYLYNSNWSEAEAQATLVLNNPLFSLTALNNTFLKNSNEAIWQLQPVNAGSNTELAKVFIIPSTGPSNITAAGGFPVYLSPQLLNSFESGDKRRQRGNWVDSINVSGTPYLYPYKYKVKALNQAVTEYLMVLRLGEQYLIRAEARAKLNNISGAQADLNAIRIRAGLSNTIASTQPELLTAISHERQVELFTEWGDRWFDMKRSGTINTIMSVVTPLKGGTWQPYKQLYPLPLNDLQKDQNLVQNTGY